MHTAGVDLRAQVRINEHFQPGRELAYPTCALRVSSVPRQRYDKIRSGAKVCRWAWSALAELAWPALVPANGAPRLGEWRCSTSKILVRSEKRESSESIGDFHLSGDAKARARKLNPAVSRRLCRCSAGSGRIAGSGVSTDQKPGSWSQGRAPSMRARGQRVLLFRC